MVASEPPANNHLEQAQLSPVSGSVLTHDVILSLRKFIVSNGLAPGDRLPPEREIAAQLQVGRSTVREALTVLEVLGAITRKTKRGTVVSEVDFGLIASLVNYLVVKTDDDLRQLFEARRLIEVSLVPLVVKHWSKESRKALKAAVKKGEDDLEAGGSGLEADILFHEELVNASRNVFLKHYSAMIQEFFSVPSVRIPISEEQRRLTVGEHASIIKAINSGDAVKAQGILHRHLSRYIDRGIVSPNSSS